MGNEPRCSGCGKGEYEVGSLHLFAIKHDGPFPQFCRGCVVTFFESSLVFLVKGDITLAQLLAMSPEDIRADELLTMDAKEFMEHLLSAVRELGEYE